jgi:hypothetical protein
LHSDAFEYDTEEAVAFDCRKLKYVHTRDQESRPSSIEILGFFLRRLRMEFHWKCSQQQQTRSHKLLSAGNEKPCSNARRISSLKYILHKIACSIFAVDLGKLELSQERQTEIIARLWQALGLLATQRWRKLWSSTECNA